MSQIENNANYTSIKQTERKFKMSLRKKLLLIILPVIGVLLTAMMFVNYYHAVRLQTETTERYVSEISRNASVMVSDNIEWLKVQLEWIADRQDVKSMNWNNMERYLANRAFTDRAKYSLLFVICPDGSYYVAGKGKADQNLIEREYVRDIFERGKSFSMTSPDISKSTGEMKYTVAIPIEQDGAVVGILAANIGLNALCDIIGGIKIGETGYAFVVDQRTTVIGHKDRDFLMKFHLNDSISGYEGLKDIAPVIASWKPAKGHVVKPNGEECYVISHPIDNTPRWSMVTFMPEDEIEQGAVDMFKSMAFFFLLTIGVIITIVSLSVRNIVVRPLRWFCSAIEQISNGDFNQKFDYKAHDEIGMMSDSLQKMCDKLLEIAITVKTGASSLAKSSEMVNATSQRLSQGTSEQASSIEELSTTMEQMASNIAQNSQSAIQTHDVSNEAYGKFNEVMGDLSKVFAVSHDIAEKILVINDIAQETNILALNASVEAARAGELGKGFSIVANEVRTLAENSKLAADQIIELSGDGVKISEVANEVMNETLPKIKSTNSLVSEIANASMEQKLGADQINMAIQRLNVVVRENAVSSQDLAENAKDLAAQARELRAQVSFFKIGDKKQ